MNQEGKRNKYIRFVQRKKKQIQNLPNLVQHLIYTQYLQDYPLVQWQQIINLSLNKASIQKYMNENKKLQDYFMNADDLKAVMDIRQPIDVVRVVESCESITSEVNYQESLLIFLGHTGAGKTNTIQLMVGYDHQIKKQNNRWNIVPIPDLKQQHKKLKSGGQAFQSVTSEVSIFEIPFESEELQKYKQYRFCADVPGTFDTNGPVVQLANHIMINNIIKHCKEMIPIMVINAQSFTLKRLKGIRQFAEQIANLFIFKSQVQLNQHLVVIFNHAKQNSLNILENDLEILIAKQSTDSLRHVYIFLLIELQNKKSIIYDNFYTLEKGEKRKQLLEHLSKKKMVAPNKFIDKILDKNLQLKVVETYSNLKSQFTNCLQNKYIKQSSYYFEMIVKFHNIYPIYPELVNELKSTINEMLSGLMQKCLNYVETMIREQKCEDDKCQELEKCVEQLKQGDIYAERNLIQLNASYSILIDAVKKKLNQVKKQFIQNGCSKKQECMELIKLFKKICQIFVIQIINEIQRQLIFKIKKITEKVKNIFKQLNLDQVIDQLKEDLERQVISLKQIDANFDGSHFQNQFMAIIESEIQQLFKHLPQAIQSQIQFLQKIKNDNASLATLIKPQTGLQIFIRKYQRMFEGSFMKQIKVKVEQNIKGTLHIDIDCCFSNLNKQIQEYYKSFVDKLETTPNSINLNIPQFHNLIKYYESIHFISNQIKVIKQLYDSKAKEKKQSIQSWLQNVADNISGVIQQNINVPKIKELWESMPAESQHLKNYEKFLGIVNRNNTQDNIKRRIKQFIEQLKLQFYSSELNNSQNCHKFQLILTKIQNLKQISDLFAVDKFVKQEFEGDKFCKQINKLVNQIDMNELIKESTFLKDFDKKGYLFKLNIKIGIAQKNYPALKQLKEVLQNSFNQLISLCDTKCNAKIAKSKSISLKYYKIAQDWQKIYLFLNYLQSINITFQADLRTKIKDNFIQLLNNILANASKKNSVTETQNIFSLVNQINKITVSLFKNDSTNDCQNLIKQIIQVCCLNLNKLQMPISEIFQQNKQIFGIFDRVILKYNQLINQKDQANLIQLLRSLYQYLEKKKKFYNNKWNRNFMLGEFNSIKQTFHKMLQRFRQDQRLRFFQFRQFLQQFQQNVKQMKIAQIDKLTEDFGQALQTFQMSRAKLILQSIKEQKQYLQIGKIQTLQQYYDIKNDIKVKLQEKIQNGFDFDMQQEDINYLATLIKVNCHPDLKNKAVSTLKKQIQQGLNDFKSISNQKLSHFKQKSKKIRTAIQIFPLQRYTKQRLFESLKQKQQKYQQQLIDRIYFKRRTIQDQVQHPKQKIFGYLELLQSYEIYKLSRAQQKGNIKEQIKIQLNKIVQSIIAKSRTVEDLIKNALNEFWCFKTKQNQNGNCLAKIKQLLIQMEQKIINVINQIKWKPLRQKLKNSFQTNLSQTELFDFTEIKKFKQILIDCLPFCYGLGKAGIGSLIESVDCFLFENKESQKQNYQKWLNMNICDGFMVKFFLNIGKSELRKQFIKAYNYEQTCNQLQKTRKLIKSQNHQHIKKFKQLYQSTRIALISQNFDVRTFQTLINNQEINIFIKNIIQKMQFMKNVDLTLNQQSVKNINKVIQISNYQSIYQKMKTKLILKSGQIFNYLFNFVIGKAQINYNQVDYFVQINSFFKKIKQINFFAFKNENDIIDLDWELTEKIKNYKSNIKQITPFNIIHFKKIGFFIPFLTECQKIINQQMSKNRKQWIKSFKDLLKNKNGLDKLLIESILHDNLKVFNPSPEIDNKNEVYLSYLSYSQISCQQNSEIDNFNSIIQRIDKSQSKIGFILKFLQNSYPEIKCLMSNKIFQILNVLQNRSQSNVNINKRKIIQVDQVSKSIIMVTYACFLALKQINVYVAFTDKQRADFQYKKFNSFFLKLNIQNRIFFDTFQNLYANILQNGTDGSKILDQLVLQHFIRRNQKQTKKGTKILKQKIQSNVNSVLLMEDIEYLISKRMIHNSFKVTLLLKQPVIKKFFEFLLNCVQVNRAMSTQQLQNLIYPEFKKVFEKYCDPLQSLIIPQLQSIIQSAKNYKHSYRIYNRNIWYDDYDQIEEANNYNLYGYSTIFAYIYQYNRGNISQQNYNKGLSLRFKMLQFSYFSFFDIVDKTYAFSSHLVSSVQQFYQNNLNFQKLRTRQKTQQYPIKNVVIDYDWNILSKIAKQLQTNSDKAVIFCFEDATKISQFKLVLSNILSKGSNCSIQIVEDNMQLTNKQLKLRLLSVTYKVLLITKKMLMRISPYQQYSFANQNIDFVVTFLPSDQAQIYKLQACFDKLSAKHDFKLIISINNSKASPFQNINFNFVRNLLQNRLCERIQIAQNYLKNQTSKDNSNPLMQCLKFLKQTPQAICKTIQNQNSIVVQKNSEPVKIVLFLNQIFMTQNWRQFIIKIVQKTFRQKKYKIYMKIMVYKESQRNEESIQQTSFLGNVTHVINFIKRCTFELKADTSNVFIQYFYKIKLSSSVRFFIFSKQTKNDLLQITKEYLLRFDHEWNKQMLRSKEQMLRDFEILKQKQVIVTPMLMKGQNSTDNLTFINYEQSKFPSPSNPMEEQTSGNNLVRFVAQFMMQNDSKPRRKK